ncbi:MULTISPECIES: hypothetical protein [unclassified Bartonella]|uniref:hypothetical protein n=1 Tax=unclassified Bartonella TaxID=2645622 RepID=UPI0035CFA349
MAIPQSTKVHMFRKKLKLAVTQKSLEMPMFVAMPMFMAMQRFTVKHVYFGTTGLMTIEESQLGNKPDEKIRIY